VLIDEWQRLPTSWDVVRRAVEGAPGQFLLTGSATPADTPTHSGAGRIATVRMRPLSLAERDLDSTTVRLADLLGGDRRPVAGGTSLSVSDYAAEIVSSGFPAIRLLSGRLLRTQLDGYLRRIVEHDFDELGNRVRNAGMLRRWMTAYVGDGPIVAFEVKLARTINDGDVRHLKWLAERMGTDLLDAAVITTGPEAYRRPDGIAVIPAALLGP
jgi:predicted AAA+ superfamily ATPase